MTDRPAALDRDVAALVARHGVSQVIAALCRHCHAAGHNALFRVLNHVYEWSVTPGRDMRSGRCRRADHALASVPAEQDWE